VSGEERAFLRDIQRLLKKDIPSSAVPGFEPGSGLTQAERDAQTAHNAQHQQRHHGGGQAHAKPQQRPGTPPHRSGPRPNYGGGRPQRDFARLKGLHRTTH
ncbi:MAG: hypothetical protein ACRDRT_18055, partial [Pseudonocardiaceae bacterium]